MRYVSNLDKLKKAACDLFICASGNAMMGISVGELEDAFMTTKMPDHSWIPKAQFRRFFHVGGISNTAAC